MIAATQFAVAAHGAFGTHIVRGRLISPPRLRIPPDVSSAAVELVVGDNASLDGAERFDIPRSLWRASHGRLEEFVLGRICAREVLRHHGSAWLEMSPSGAPVWPAGWIGSITHWEGRAWAVSTRRSPGVRSVGIDAVRTSDPQAAEAVYEKALSPSERLLVSRDPLTLAMLVFSAKESIYKCLRPLLSRFIDFNEVQCHAIDAGTSELHFRVARDLGSHVGASDQLTVRGQITADTAYCLCSVP